MLPSDAERQDLGIVFLDFTRFTRWANERTDEEVAGFLQAFYVLASERLEPAGIRIVKTIGDALLAVFEPGRAAEAVTALRALAAEVMRRAAEAEFETALTIKVHVGPVIAGSFGPPGQERFDVLGKTVNETAMLRGEGLILSASLRL